MTQKYLSGKKKSNNCFSDFFFAKALICTQQFDLLLAAVSNRRSIHKTEKINFVKTNFVSNCDFYSFLIIYSWISTVLANAHIFNSRICLLILESKSKFRNWEYGLCWFLRWIVNIAFENILWSNAIRFMRSNQWIDFLRTFFCVTDWYHNSGPFKF